MNLRSRLALVAVVAAAGALVTAAPAAAAVPGLTYVTVFSVTNSTVYKAVTAQCPAGLRVIGLGYWLEGAPGSIVLDDFIPNATSVTVGAGEVVGPGEPSDGTTANWRVGATAVCAAAPPGLEIVSAVTGTQQGTDFAETTATCPAGKALLGAGVALTQGFGQISVNSLNITGASVRGVAVDDEDGYSGTWSMRVYAVCATPLPGLQVVSAFTELGSPATSSVTASCPTGTRAIGGGWDLNRSNEVLAIDLFIADGTGATMIAHEDDTGFNGFWRNSVRAVCVSV